MAKASKKPVEKQVDRPVFVRFAASLNGRWCGAVVRQWNADGTLSLCVFPHGIQTLSFFDSVPHKNSPLAVAEGRPHQCVWDWPENDAALRAEVAELRKRIDELTELVTN